jgi:hypothetical protein
MDRMDRTLLTMSIVFGRWLATKSTWTARFHLLDSEIQRMTTIRINRVRITMWWQSSQFAFVRPQESQSTQLKPIYET